MYSIAVCVCVYSFAVRLKTCVWWQKRVDHTNWKVLKSICVLCKSPLTLGIQYFYILIMSYISDTEVLWKSANILGSKIRAHFHFNRDKTATILLAINSLMGVLATECSHKVLIVLLWLTLMGAVVVTFISIYNSTHHCFILFKEWDADFWL